MENYKQGIKTGENYVIESGIPAKKIEKNTEMWRDPEAWRTPQGGGVISSPNISDNMVFFGSLDTFFYALDKATGSLLWKFKAGDVIVSTAVIKNDMVVFGSQDGFLYALKAESGELLWKYRTGGMIQANAGFYEGQIYIGSSNGYMHCLALDGTLIWKYRTGGAVNSTPVFFNDKLYFGCYDKHFYCLNTRGEVIWKYYVGEWMDNGPAIFANGEEIWTVFGKKRDYEGPASVCFGAYNKNFYVLDSETGSLQWMRRMDGIISWSHPHIREGKIYFGDWSGQLYCLDAATGSLEWKALTGGKIDTSPVISSGYIYVASHDGNMYALSLEGKFSWKYQTGGLVASKPSLEKDILYFGSMDTTFYALDASTRKIIWKFITGAGKPAPIEDILKFVEQINESKRVFSAWKPEIIKPAYKEDKNVTFIAAPSDHVYASQNTYKTDSAYSLEKKKKEPWER